MPSSSQAPVGTSSARILLVEEYKALAIAFGSALKKFAPDFETRTVSSFGEADKLVRDLKPALLVIDCDPPPLHSVKFFERLRSANPDARVLIVAAENASEFTDREGIRPALEFIKKPFELQKFGAVIQSLLATDAPESGTVRHLKLLDLVLLYAITGAQVVLRMEGAGGRSGEVHFAEGRIIHAAVMGKSGVEALAVMLRWRALRFSEGERALDSPRTIQGAWAPTLRAAMEGAALEELPADEEPVVVPMQRKAVSSLPATKIVVVDDTDLLLVFVEEILVSAHPELEIISALSGFDGLKCAAMEKPDLLLLDYDLPDITGADVCEKLLDNEETARIPVIMMSGHVSEMMATAERFENVVATIAKPFLAAALNEVVERTLRDLPKLRTPFTKKTPPTPAPVEVLAPVVEHPAPSRNGHSEPIKPGPSQTRPPSLLSLAGLAEERVPASILDPSPSMEEEMEAAAAASKTTIAIVERDEKEDEDSSRSESLSESESDEAEDETALDSSATIATDGPAGIRTARSNKVVLGFPLEVLNLELSARLHVTEIRARSFSSNVSLHILPKSLPRPTRRDTPFRLAQVQLDRHGQIDTVRVSPAARREDFRPTRYRLTIDGVELLATENSDAIRLTPTEVAPMRMELLGLFELCGVELSPDFGVQYLLLKIRDKRMRVTLLPEAIHLGATFTAKELSITSAGTISEIRLVAV